MWELGGNDLFSRLEEKPFVFRAEKWHNIEKISHFFMNNQYITNLIKSDRH